MSGAPRMVPAPPKRPREVLVSFPQAMEPLQPRLAVSPSLFQPLQSANSTSFSRRPSTHCSNPFLISEQVPPTVSLRGFDTAPHGLTQKWILFDCETVHQRRANPTNPTLVNALSSN